MAEHLTYRDIAAALKAARDMGVKCRRIEVRKDAVVLIPGEPETEQVEIDPDVNPELAAALRAIESVKI